MNRMLKAGADKVSINTAAVGNPDLIRQGRRGIRQPVHLCSAWTPSCVSVDPTRWEVYTHTGADGGRASGMDALEWADRAVRLGAGEIVVNSIDADGTKGGYDLELLRAISDSVSVPVVASGGAGAPEHLRQAVAEGHADAVLAASIFHFGEYSISQAKEYLARHDVPVRRGEP